MSTKLTGQVLTVLLLMLSGTLSAQRSETLLEKNWKFSKGDFKDAALPEFDDSRWQTVCVPHDWAIYGPFDIKNDLQDVAITQNLETQSSLKTGRTGGLPYTGCGWYRTSFSVPEGKTVTLLFDGAMSEARVYVNGKEACFWPYGYNSFHCDVTSLLRHDGKKNTLAVRLENRPQSSRWYPGAGLYRNVHLIITEKTHVPVWGTYVTTPHADSTYAAVRLLTEIAGAADRKINIDTRIISPEGKVVAHKNYETRIIGDRPVEQNFIIDRPSLWSPETPALYKAVSRIYADGQLTDSCTTRFGVRSIEFVADKGFFLNGRQRKFQGVCNHHDLGPLGAAVNRAALRHQILMLKDMGCDAIRTSHNMPAPELVEAGGWCNLPDIDFALAEDHHWTLGQFVWTGFDYLGEPFPYDTDAWPNHSSMFGIIDLASLPKDRFYMYRSIWNLNDATLHILPHWTWPGREGEVTPVFVYTSYPAAELFVNGKSQGRREKNNSSLKSRYRLMWNDVKYEPGEIRVVAYDKDGRPAAEKTVRTAGKPYRIELECHRTELSADGKDLAYVTVKVTDKDGNLCPTDNRTVRFSVSGAGSFRAVANGDATCLEPFQKPQMHAFNGMLTTIVQSGERSGRLTLKAKASGLKSAEISIDVK